MDVTLMLLVNGENKGHFLQVITKVKDQSGPKVTIFEPSSIEGHVYLETRSSCSVKVDGAVGFLANRSNYLHTEYLISWGYDQPNVKFKLIRSNEHSKNVTALFGLEGGKPTATVSYAAGKLTSTTTEIADDEVAKRWVVTHQPRYDNWDSTSSCYHSLSTTVNRWLPGNYQAPKYYNVLDIKAEYGIAVEVAESISRGMLTYTGNGEGNKQASDAWNKNKECSEGNTSLSVSGDPDVPEVAAKTSFQTSFSRFPNALSLFKQRKDEEEPELVPMCKLVVQGRNHGDMGWNHSEQQWYYPVWPKLDCNLEASWDGSKVRWKLDWEHEGGYNH
ncbi:hypothetical protein L208DRAFT_1379885 [Tricholoma matsutake]|nr:hypothetical protein L208DRAFT_1379885 [Tricholoma matsutake 945]